MHLSHDFARLRLLLDTEITGLVTKSCEMSESAGTYENEQDGVKFFFV